MLPIRDENPVHTFPIVTIVIIALNVVAFLFWEPTLGDPQGRRADDFFFCHAEIPWEITHQTSLAEGGEAAREEIAQQLDLNVSSERFQSILAQDCGHKVWWESIFVAMFLHGGWLHIGGNMLFLWIFGNNVEDRLGPILYVLFYLAAGIAATLAQLATGPSSVIPNLGASGAIAGVLGAYIVMFPRRRVLTVVFLFFITFLYLPAWVVLLGWFVLQLFSGVGGLSRHLTSGVAYFAHIGGFVFGAVLALLFFPKEGFARRPPPPRPDFGGRRFGRRRPDQGFPY